MRFLEDYTTGKLYPAMTDAERGAASKSGSNLQWVGPSVVAATGSKTAGIGPMGHAEMYAPATLSGSSVSHWNTSMTPQELLEPFYSVPLHDPGSPSRRWSIRAGRSSPAATGSSTRSAVRRRQPCVR